MVYNDNDHELTRELYTFQQRIGFGQRELSIIEQYKHIFIDRKDELAEIFFDYFYNLPETRLLLENDHVQKNIRTIWATWIENMFIKKFDEEFLYKHWNSGIRHVQIKVDHRFIMLGYSKLRQLLQDIISMNVPEYNQFQLSLCIDKMIDFCLLIETHAFLNRTTQCDIEVINGIAHQIRNPLTIIGGNILRLIKTSDIDSHNYQSYSRMLSEIKRMDAMVTDVAEYSDMFRKPPRISNVLLKDLLNEALTNITNTSTPQIMKVRQKLEYMHSNPVKAGLVGNPVDWPFSSARWYLTGRPVGVEITPAV